jgi:hypothetical protein
MLMLRRFLPCALAALIGAAFALSPSSDLAPRAEARPDAEPAVSQSKLVAAEAAYFVTLRPNDLLSDPLIAAALDDDVIKDMASDLPVPLKDVERVTVVGGVGGGDFTIIQTHKPYDKDKVRDAVLGSARPAKEKTFDKVKDKDGKKDREDKEEKKAQEEPVREKKVGGRTLYYTGKWETAPNAYSPLDKTAFVMGDPEAVQRLLAGKGKASAEMAAALALGGKHSVVLGLDGKRVASMFVADRKRLEKQMRKADEPEKRKDKEEKSKDDKEKDEPKKKEDKGKDDSDYDDGLDPSDYFGWALFAPYRPLYRAKFTLATLDVGKTYALNGKVTVHDKADLDDAETSLRSLLYVLRELAVLLPKQERELRGLKPLSPFVALALTNAKVESKGDTVSASVSMTPPDGLVKKLADSVRQGKKKREQREKKREKDKDKGDK